MEVLNSIDIIGDEIKEEARKKAETILNDANSEIEELQRKAEEKLATLKAEKDELYKKRLEKYKDDLFVTIPLEKWKEKIRYVEASLCDALEKYFEKLGDDDLLAILKHMLSRFAPILQKKEIIIKCDGFDLDKIRNMVSSVIPTSKIKNVMKATESEKSLFSIKKGFIIEDVDKTFVCKIGAEHAKDEVEERIKEELYLALFGEELK